MSVKRRAAVRLTGVRSGGFWSAVKSTVRKGDSVEYGIFNDEGCIARGWFDKASAHAEMDTEYPDEPGAYVAEMCPYHDEQPADTCEDCSSEDDDE